jgi:DNA-binding CsgD family transcriptional regulator
MNPAVNSEPPNEDPLLAEMLVEIEREIAAADPAHARARARLEDAEIFAQALFEIDSHWPKPFVERPAGRYAGKAHRQLFDDLWLYAWPVVRSFIRRQRMGEVARRYGALGRVSVSPEDMVVLTHSGPEREALALDVIADAVGDFERHALIGRRWSPAGGASLRTWFIGTCGLKFGRAYAKWSKQRGTRLDETARRHGIDAETIGTSIVDRIYDPTLVIDRVDLLAMIDKAQPMTKQILGMMASGMTQVEISGELGLTPGAVGARLRRFRERVNDRAAFAARRSAFTVRPSDLWLSSTNREGHR